MTWPPKLGMILKGYPRISETFISNEILLLESLGFKIHIFSMRQPRESFCHDSVKKIKAKVDYLPETILKPLPKFLYHNIRLAVKEPGLYYETFQKALIRFRRTRKSATLKHLLQAGYLVNKFLPSSGVRHFHAHFAHSPASVALFASELSGLPFSFTAHAKDIYTSDPGQLREKIALARFVVTCTEYNRRHLLALAEGLKTPIHRIYHGIDTGLFDNGRDLRADAAPPYRVLSVARLIEKKGIPTVLRAVKLLHDRGVRLAYTLIGDGTDREKTLGLIRQLGIEPVCRWLGVQPHHVVLEHYRRADLFVLGCEVAANGDRDGIPNVLFESMAMGVPVVATGVSAIPELVESGRTGWLVPPGRPEALADAMHAMLTDAGLRRRVIPAARQRVLRDFDNRALVARLADIYRSALATSKIV